MRIPPATHDQYERLGSRKWTRLPANSHLTVQWTEHIPDHLVNKAVSSGDFVAEPERGRLSEEIDTLSLLVSPDDMVAEAEFEPGREDCFIGLMDQAHGNVVLIQGPFEDDDLSWLSEIESKEVTVFFALQKLY